MAGDKLLGMWNRGNTEKESCMDEERESQPRKKLSHSIEEILRRPTCVRKEKTAHRNWSVIKENTRTSNQLTCAGMFFHYSLLKTLPRGVATSLSLKYITIYQYILVNYGTFSIQIETPQIRLESPKATTDCASEYLNLLTRKLIN